MKIQKGFVWNRPLGVAAWTMFAVSFFLPAYQEMRGFQCARSYAVFWPRAIQGDWPSIHYLLLMTFPNLLMISSPIVLLKSEPNGRWLKALRWSTVIALALASSILLILYPKGMLAYLRAGSYAWVGSMALLCLATIVPQGNLRERGAPKVGLLCG